MKQITRSFDAIKEIRTIANCGSFYIKPDTEEGKKRLVEIKLLGAAEVVLTESLYKEMKEGIEWFQGRIAPLL
jgi:hypothetical protein